MQEEPVVNENEIQQEQEEISLELEEKITSQENQEGNEDTLETCIENEEQEFIVQEQTAYDHHVEKTIDYLSLWGYDVPQTSISDGYLEHSQLEERSRYNTHHEVGVLTQGNAHTITMKIANMNVFAASEGISVQEREKYEHWQRDVSNKVLRNIWRMANTIHYNGNFLPMLKK